MSIEQKRQEIIDRWGSVLIPKKNTFVTEEARQDIINRWASIL